MEWFQEIFFTVFLIAAAAIYGVHGYGLVTGTVFCDQCKDGQISLFDYPLYGIKVGIACPGSDGQLTMWREETTNWLGSYAIKFEGIPDLSGCYAQVSGNAQGSSGCGAAAGPAMYPRLMFRMFDMEMYAVDPLLSQPAQPMPFCSSSTSPVVSPAPPVRFLPPVPRVPPLPPLPRLPPMPPVPYLEVSACPHQKWMMPEYKCYWKVVSPDTKVAVIFGLTASRRYGTDMTLWEGMNGRGDPYMTLLREGTTALLNSYSSIQFPFHPLDVIQHMNWALMGSTRQVLHTALSFLRANSGTGTSTSTSTSTGTGTGTGAATCRFTPCK